MARPRPSLLPLAFLALLVGLALGPAAARRAEDGPRVTAFVPGAARVLLPIEARVLVHDDVPGRTLELLEMRVLADGAVRSSRPLVEELAGDPLYAELSARIERLPRELTERRGPRRFAPKDAPELGWTEVEDALATIRSDVETLREAWAAGAPQPFVELSVTLELAALLDGVPAGDARELAIEVDWTAGGPVRTARTTASIRRLPPLPAVPASVGASLGPLQVRAGDLHVHSCKGEAVNACAPFANCEAESLQTSGSFTYAELRSQYQALGYDWFAATDHSYCIDSDADYDVIVAEAAALTTSDFVVLPDIELSSDESGPQTGTDVGDLVCFGTTEANHMGAHGLAERLEGGDNGTQGFCDGLFGGDALAPFESNVAEVRAQGGWPIVNHPVGAFGWNSFEATRGLEAGELHGVEIWNGSSQLGQGGQVGRWVEWLLAGRVLYAYSGSDTHDEAFAFGANHALLPAGAPFTPKRLQDALRAGRNYVSDQHLLILEVEEDGRTLPMGTLRGLAPGHPASPLAVRAHYDFGADTASVTIFAGRAGDAAETVLCQSGPLTGAGVFECSGVLDPGANTWYRAYAENGAATSTAYTNPVFFLPGTCAWTPFGTGLGGANVATLASDSSPGLGTSNTVELSGFGAAPAALVLYSPLPASPPVPLAGGWLLLAPPLFTAGVVPLAGGAGELSFEVPANPAFLGVATRFQAFAPLASLPGGVALSSGLTATLCLPGS